MQNRAAPVAARLPGEPGIWILILGDLMMFAIFFGTFAFYRAQAPADFSLASRALSPTLGAANTLLLLTSSWCVARALAAYRSAAASTARRLIAWGWLLGFGFVFDKAVEYRNLIRLGIGTASSDFFLLYFMLTGIHLVHVFVGLAVLAWVRARMLRSVTEPGNSAAIECGTLFWHLVDLLWIVLFALLYLLD